MGLIDRIDWRRLWFFGAAALCFFFILAIRLGGYFSLRNESNLAALFSGMLLLVVALHAYDGWELCRGPRPRVARSWLVMSAILVLLSIDEIASVHERIPGIGEFGYWWSMLPFALILFGLLGYAMRGFASDPQHRRTPWLIALAFLAFGWVALMEYAEGHIDFEWHSNSLRAMLEEGAELFGSMVLLRATMGNTQGILARDRSITTPVFELVHRLRRPILVAGSALAPLVAYLTVLFPPGPWGHGQPAEWPAAAMFFCAALAVARPFFARGQGVGGLGWALTLLCCLGCVGTTMDLLSPWAWPTVTALSFLVGAIWVLDPRYTPSRYAPAAVAMIVLLGLFWFFRDSTFVTFCVVQYVALAVYSVNSSQNAGVHSGGALTARISSASVWSSRTSAPGLTNTVRLSVSE